jgi:hypothetical protein
VLRRDVDRHDFYLDPIWTYARARHQMITIGFGDGGSDVEDALDAFVGDPVAHGSP